jgi:cell division cycle 20-like protein 1 (cofactor of APC complex)
MTLQTDAHSNASIPVPSSSKRAMIDSKAPSEATPLRIATPPPADRGRLETRHSLDMASKDTLRNTARKRDGAGPGLDIDAVDHALLRDLSRPHRESTPSASPHRKRQRINGDRYVENLNDSVQNKILTCLRFIPTRSGQDLQASFSLLHEDGSPATPSKQKKRTPHGELHFQKS